MEAQELPEYFEGDTQNETQDETQGETHTHAVAVESIRLTTAVVAVLMGTSTLLSHRSHTEHLLLQIQANRDWGSYEVKHLRSQQYEALARLAAVLPSGKDLAATNLGLAIEEECGRPPENACMDSFVQTPIVVEKAPLPRNKKAQAHTAPETLSLSEPPPGSSNASPKPGAAAIRSKAAATEKEAAQFGRKADAYDSAQLFFGISLVLCAISLLSKVRWYWRLSFISTMVGIAISVWGNFMGSM